MLQSSASGFEYDHALPLDVREHEVTYRDRSAIQELSYASPGHGRVSAYWVSPGDERRCAGLLFVHPGPGDRSSFLEEALTLADEGAASLLVQAPWADAESWGKTMGQPDHDRQEHVQTAIDLRRGIDFITSHPLVDRARIGYVGHSFGAMFGGILAGVDKRLRAIVLMSGVGSFAEVAAANIPTLKGSALENYGQGLRPIDPINFIGQASPSRLFFQLGHRDTFARDTLLAYARAASEPKQIAWYDADHYSVNEAGRAERMEWLRKQVVLLDVSRS